MVSRGTRVRERRKLLWSFVTLESSDDERYDDIRLVTHHGLISDVHEELGGRTIVAKDTVYMVKVAEKHEETSDVIGYGMLSYAVTPYSDKVWRAMLAILSRPGECRRLHSEVDAQLR